MSDHADHSDHAGELVRRSLAGDESATYSLVEEHRGLVYGLCLRMLGHPQDAEDATQETLLRMLRSLHRFDQTREFRPWLLAIAGNRCRSYLAARSRRPVARDLGEEIVDRQPDPRGARQLAEEVNQALAHLRSEYRQAFLLLHEQELSYEEIGTVLGCPVGTVKTWVHRARRELIKLLRERGALPERPTSTAE